MLLLFTVNSVIMSAYIHPLLDNSPLSIMIFSKLSASNHCRRTYKFYLQQKFILSLNCRLIMSPWWSTHTACWLSRSWWRRMASSRKTLLWPKFLMLVSYCLLNLKLTIKLKKYYLSNIFWYTIFLCAFIRQILNEETKFVQNGDKDLLQKFLLKLKKT